MKEAIYLFFVLIIYSGALIASYWIFQDLARRAYDADDTRLLDIIIWSVVVFALIVGISFGVTFKYLLINYLGF